MTYRFSPTAALAAALAAGVAMALPAVAQAETFRWAGTTDPQTLDPHASNTAPVLGFLNNVYEGLVRRDKHMQIEPALSTSWEKLEEGGWRFNLREGVIFMTGQSSMPMTCCSPTSEHPPKNPIPVPGLLRSVRCAWWMTTPSIS